MPDTPQHVKALIERAYEEKTSFLDLGNCGLTTIPKEINILSTFLEALNLGSYHRHGIKNIASKNTGHGNNLALVSTEFLIFDSFQNLKSLYLYKNQITDKGAEAIGRLRNLINLNISDNQITDKGVEAIGGMSKLINLNISSNRITDKGAEAIGRMSNLIYLDIGFSQFSEKVAKAITRLSNLTHLDIGGNQITEKRAEVIGRLNNLVYLNISGSQITDKETEAIARLSNLTHLNISFNQITNKGAEAVGQLDNLANLEISYNQITDKGAEAIGRLSNLAYLDIRRNQITAKGSEVIGRLNYLVYLDIGLNQITDKGAEAIARLSNLTNLNISYNQITEKGAEAIGRLVNLVNLDIRDNQIIDKGAEAIGRLSNLTNLDISRNQITDKGAEAIGRLSNLTNLIIGLNQITDKGAEAIGRLINLVNLNMHTNQITDKGAEAIGRLSNLINLNIRGNQITELETIHMFINKMYSLAYIFFDKDKIEELPKEIGEDILALRGYFTSTKKIPNTLVKMILIGNTTAGKSSLADFLINKKYDPQRESTHGIQLWRWKTSKDENALQVNIWDFGGQDYYHATHNLFLDDKTIFLLLQTGKEIHLQNADEKQYLPQNYWLGNIRSITNKESAIWYVQSKSENMPLAYLDTELINRYNVTQQFKISVKEAVLKEPGGESDFNYFISNLKQELQKLSKNELPASWIKIRDKYLPEWRSKELCIPVKKFRDYCEAALKNYQALLTDLMNSWDGLLPYLKGSGEIIYFREGQGLTDLVFLSAEALTSGIYKLLSKEAINNRGEFTLDDLKKTEESKAETYLNVLLTFGIIFERADKKGVYVAPQYLPENPYTKHFQQLIKIAYVIHFPDYMSRSIITKFLVQYAGKDMENYYWRYGAFFKQSGLNVFVRIDAEKQKVYVHVEDGNDKNKFSVMRELFLFFTVPVEKTNQFIDASNLKPGDDWKKEMESRMQANYLSADKVPDEIELSVNDIDFASVKDLREAIEYKAYKIRSRQGGYIEFNAVIHQLLNTSSTIPKKIFLSYSHRDDEYKKELDTHFAALKRSGKIETWQDRKIIAGEDWDKTIEEALFSADIALLLLSPDFMASDYIWNVEIPKAFKKGVTIVPIFLRPCDFNESVFEIYKKQGLPRDTEWIVGNKFTYRDEAYLKVIEGIKKLL